MLLHNFHNNLSVSPAFKKVLCTIEFLQHFPLSGQFLADLQETDIKRFFGLTPFNEKVSTNIAKKFFTLLHKHFSPRNKYHKIFSKNYVKLNYFVLTPKNY